VRFRKLHKSAVLKRSNGRYDAANSDENEAYARERGYMDDAVGSGAGEYHERECMFSGSNGIEGS
jgi:hypothetical protein